MEKIFKYGKIERMLELPDSILTKKQTMVIGWKKINDDEKMIVTIRYDDDCNNGHNSFSITADIETLRGRDVAGGCLHDEIEKYFPELSHLIKWHLCSSDSPMYYLENTLFHVSECESSNHKIGDIKTTQNFLQFGDFPILSQYKNDFMEWIINQSADSLEVVEVPHAREPETYSPNYTFMGFVDNWYKAPFRSKNDADMFLLAFKWCKPALINKPVSYYQKSSHFNLEYGRSCAIWPDAPLEDLRNVDKLLNRLPALMGDFKQAVESLGFVY